MLKTALTNFDTRAERSLQTLARLLVEHGASPIEMSRELSWHRAELAAERLRLPEQMAREIRAIDADFTGGSAGIH
jgi:hypothetical protein